MGWHAGSAASRPPTPSRAGGTVRERGRPRQIGSPTLCFRRSGAWPARAASAPDRAAHGALAAAQDGEAAVQPVLLPHAPRRRRSPDVVQVGAALLDGPPGGRPRGDQPAVGQQVDHDGGAPASTETYGASRSAASSVAGSRSASSPWPNSAREAATACVARGVAVDERRQLLRERPLRLPGRRALVRRDLEGLDLRARPAGQDLQVRRDVTVVAVEPELEERVGRGHRRVEPERAALGLAELRAVGLGEQRGREGMDRGLGSSAVDEVQAGRQVAPLVAAAELERAAVPPVQLEEVQALQQLVAELGVGDALVGGEPGGDGVLGRASC